MHRVLDLFEACDDDVTEDDIKTVFREMFEILLKADVLYKTELWECADHIELPDCMKAGLFKEALELKKFGPSYHFLMTKRIIDVQRHLHRMEGVFRGRCGPGERIVRKRDSV